jgi:hypothetical protein
MAKSAEELRRENELLKEQISLNKALKQVETERFQTDENLLDNVRENRNIVEDITKSLRFQVTEKKSLRKASDSIYEVTRNSFRLLKEELGLDKTKDKLLKDQRTITKEILTLESLKGKIKEGDPERQAAINAEIDAQIKSAKKLKEQITFIAEESEKVRNNLGVKTFGALSDLTSKIPGLSKFSDPFEEAAEASRKQALFNKETFGTTKGLNRANLKALKTGKNLSKDKIKELGLEGKLVDKNGKALAGQAAAQKAQALGLTNSISPLKAGFKSLGPVLKKALGPISIILMVKDVIQFFVGAMFEASKQSAELARGLGISREAARSVRGDTFITANTLETTNKTLKETILLQKDIFKAQNDVNKALGTNLNLNTELGDVGKDILSNTATLTTIMGVSAEAQNNINRQSIRTGKFASDITKEVFGTVRAQNLLNNTQIDEQEVLEQVAKTSKEIQAIFGFNTAEIAKAVYQAKKLGFEFSDLNSAASNLMDFEGSISKELEAELILGRDINLEKARAASLNNDLVGVGKELRAQNIDIVELQKTNRIAAESAAAAMGMTVEQAVKAQEEFELQNKIQDNLNKSRLKGVKIMVDGQEQVLSASKLQEMALGDIQQAVLKIGVTEQELTEILGEQVYQNKLNEDAAARFRKNMDKVKEAFSSLVEGGVLDDLSNILTGITKSALFQSFAQEGAKKRRAAEAKEKGIEGEQLEKLQDAAESEQGAGGVLAKVGAGAAIGTLILPGIGTAVGAGIGGIWAGMTELMERDKEVMANKIARDLEMDEIGGYGSSNNIDVQDFTIRTHPKDTLVMAGGTKLNEDSKETNQLLKTLITAVENGGNVYLNNQLVGEISSQQQLNSFRAGS